ncbi:MAG: hypothetical protein L0221_12785, partial [Chloroflexi bacterium]|nr:hypothetical protein [Chloroflexota bacterium]
MTAQATSLPAPEPPHRRDSGKAPPLGVALLGFGTVGQAVARILVDRHDVADRLHLTHVFNRNIARKRVAWTPEATVWTECIDEVLASKPDVIVETVGGTEPT